MEVFGLSDLLDGLRDLPVVHDDRQSGNLLSQFALTFDDLLAHPPEGSGELTDLVLSGSGRVQGSRIEGAIREGERSPGDGLHGADDAPTEEESTAEADDKDEAAQQRLLECELSTGSSQL